MARVWGGVVVEENNLQVHISAAKGWLGFDEDAGVSREQCNLCVLALLE